MKTNEALQTKLLDYVRSLEDQAQRYRDLAAKAGINLDEMETIVSLRRDATHLGFLELAQVLSSVQALKTELQQLVEELKIETQNHRESALAVKGGPPKS